MRNILFRSSKAWPLAVVLFMISMVVLTYILAGRAYSEEVMIRESGNTQSMNWAFFSAALVTGLSTIAAAIAVGLVGSSAMGAMGERPEMAGRALIFVGLAEGIAIYGLIVSIMILGKV
jgi:V/A-type H+-transporting ATPase subunit K